MKKHYAIILATLAVLFALFYRPIWEYFVNGNTTDALGSFQWTLMHTAPYLIAFYACYLWLIPKYLFDSNRLRAFWIANTLLFIVLYMLKYAVLRMINEMTFADYTAWLVPHVFTYFLVVGTAIGIKYYVKNVEDLEKERENQKAELQWLKNQLNPHFLFNTMNNISAQIYTNPDEAQENLARLSGVLRYALYETQEEKVPLDGEIEFMQDYITLMKLRCTDRTTVSVDMDCPTAGVKILPLLYISLIENAFKHGVSNKETSFIRISLTKTDGRLVFTAENSNFPKTENRSGSGIGIENLKRRLALAYKDHYHFTYGLDLNNNYQAKLEIEK